MTLGLAGAEVSLLSTHDAWAKEFEIEKTRIVEAIGPHILDIQHVGSTSIRGVPAKPILDVLVGVENFERAGVCVAPMESIGYFYRGEFGIPRRHYFVRGDPRTHHVHMVARSSRDWHITVTFRDYLRSDPDSAREYTEAKQRLAAKYAQNRSAYQQEKDKVVEGILERALKSQ